MNTLTQDSDDNSKHTTLSSPEGTGKEEVIYDSRFSDAEEQTREKTWQILCSEFFGKFISPKSVVADIGAGDGLFIKNIEAAKKYAVDLSPHAKRLERFGINVILSPAGELETCLPEKVDVIFMSNFLEHLPNKTVLLEVLESCRKSLKPGGRVMILQPNIRYAGADYWNYIDHHIALNEESVREALEITGFSVDKLIPRFLPYTARSKAGHLAGGDRTEFIVKTYLKFPLLWKFFGAQTFAIGSVKMSDS